MSYKNHIIPLHDLEDKPLANTKHMWKCGSEWFEYARNSEGYRSGEFQKNPRFLFAGCSETFGESAKYETVWAHKLFDKLKDDGDTYCNIALPGIDVAIIIKHVLMFIAKYGKPENLFIIFPQFNRIVEDKGDHFSTVTFFKEPEDDEDHDSISKAENLDYTNDRSINAIETCNLLQISNFINLCKILDINLLWSTWDLNSHTRISRDEGSDDYIKILNDCNITDLAIDLGYNFKTIELRRSDGNHHGEIFHEYWSRQFNKQYQKNLNDNPRS
jgi:hypothetical protein